MPIQTDVVNLIFTKEIVAKKYKGGIEQFRKDFLSVPKEYADLHKINTEDNELFGLGQRNYDSYNFYKLAKGGFSEEYIDTQQEGVAIVFRYENKEAPSPDWLVHKTPFIWHKECNPESIAKAEEISKMSIGEIQIMFDRGEKPWSTFT